jgi:hypothetical protein
MDPILYLTPITMVCPQISSKTNRKLSYGTPLAVHCTPNRTAIRTQNRTCRRPLKELIDRAQIVVILPVVADRNDPGLAVRLVVRADEHDRVDFVCAALEFVNQLWTGRALERRERGARGH